MVRQHRTGGGARSGLKVNIFLQWIHLSIEILFFVEFDVYQFTIIAESRKQ